MTESRPFEPSRYAPPRRRRSPVPRWILIALGAVVVFGLGAALGAALESNPPSGGSHTYVRTYGPLPPAPVPRTVTLTLTSP